MIILNMSKHVTKMLVIFNKRDNTKSNNEFLESCVKCFQVCVWTELLLNNLEALFQL
jgi:hypothetical protein